MKITTFEQNIETGLTKPHSRSRKKFPWDFQKLPWNLEKNQNFPDFAWVKRKMPKFPEFPWDFLQFENSLRFPEFPECVATLK